MVKLAFFSTIAIVLVAFGPRLRRKRPARRIRGPKAPGGALAGRAGQDRTQPGAMEGSRRGTEGRAAPAARGPRAAAQGDPLRALAARAPTHGGPLPGGLPGGVDSTDRGAASQRGASVPSLAPEAAAFVDRGTHGIGTGSAHSRAADRGTSSTGRLVARGRRSRGSSRSGQGVVDPVPRSLGS